MGTAEAVRFLASLSGEGELYDLMNDPHEMQNIFDTSTAKAELVDMIRARPNDAVARLPQVGMA